MGTVWDLQIYRHTQWTDEGEGAHMVPWWVGLGQPIIGLLNEQSSELRSMTSPIINYLTPVNEHIYLHGIHRLRSIFWLTQYSKLVFCSMQYDDNTYNGGRERGMGVAKHASIMAINQCMCCELWQMPKNSCDQGEAIYMAMDMALTHCTWTHWTFLMLQVNFGKQNVSEPNMEHCFYK